MKARLLFGTVLITPVLVIAALAGRTQRPPSPPVPPPAATPPSPTAKNEHLDTPPPPFSDGIYPCTFCHDDTLKPNPKRRFVEDHEDIKLKHDEQNRWCLDCHDMKNRDVLHLASGDPLPFEESYKLCGQCHGEKYRDWRAGVHGRRTGQWNGQKGYLLCVNCHSPHEPHFKPMAPKAAPNRPSRPK